MHESQAVEYLLSDGRAGSPLLKTFGNIPLTITSGLMSLGLNMS